MPIQTLQFETGETTCASKSGVFCPWAGQRGMTGHAVCMLFVVSLKEKDGWLQRHKFCMERLGKGTPFHMPSSETFPDSEVDET